MVSWQKIYSREYCVQYCEIALRSGAAESQSIMGGYLTHQAFVSAMHRASAIVTDEGGITSHAAIVSREFGIPCVVGTKKATAAFKDGDVLDVDAEKGVVEKTSVKNTKWDD